MESVLIAGNTFFFGPGEIEKTAEHFHVTVISFTDRTDDGKKGMENVRYHHMGNRTDDLPALFSAQSFSAVWYVSQSADSGRFDPDEGMRITALLKECRRMKVGKMILIDSGEGNRLDADLKSDQQLNALGIRQMEHMAMQAAADDVKLIVLQIPYVSNSSLYTWLNTVFECIRTGRNIDLPCTEDSYLDLLSASDLLPLLWHITNETDDCSGVYAAGSGYEITYGQLADELHMISSGTEIRFHDEKRRALPVSYPYELRRQYGFIPVKNELEQLDKRYQLYLQKVHEEEEKRSWTEKGFGKILMKLLPVIELAVLFVVTEFLNRYTADSVYFRIIDVRLFYIFVMGCSFGLRYGIAAAVAECVSVLLTYERSGGGVLMVIYNFTYWIPFIFYLITGAAAGYTTDLKKQQNKNLEREISTIRDKYLFLKYAYDESLANQASYRNQIWSFSDSYGKINSFVHELDHDSVQEISGNAVGVLEKSMDTAAVSVHRVSAGCNGAELLACSEKMNDSLPEFADKAEIEQYLETCRKEGVWANRDFNHDQPVYVGLTEDGHSQQYLIMIWEVSAENMNTWYVNRFRTVCDLIGTFIRRAEK